MSGLPLGGCRAPRRLMNSRGFGRGCHERARRSLTVGERERGHLGRGAACETPALRWGEGARPPWPGGSGRDARSSLGRGSAAILAARQCARRPLTVGERERGHLWPGGSVRDARSPLGRGSAAILAARQRVRRPLSVGERERGHLGCEAAGETPALRWGEGARPSWPRGSGRDARSPLGRERGHLGRGAAGETPAHRWGEGARPSWLRGSG